MNFDASIIDNLRAVALISGGEFHASLGSTNDRAIEFIKHGGGEAPYLILAQEQTAGRGRGANAWWSAPGALTFTVVVAPSNIDLPEARFGLVSLAAALSIASTARSRLLGDEVTLKWPNDVFLSGRKLAGVLVEVPPARPQRIAVGIGLNVNNSFAQAPDHVANIGVALCDLAGEAMNIDGVLKDLLRELDRRLHSLAAGAEQVVAEFRTSCLLTNRQVTIVASDEPISGRCLGIDDQGALRIETPAGERRCFGGVVKSFGACPASVVR